jgi:hypothetical protein
MRVAFSPGLTAEYGEPSWLVHEDDRNVSYEFPLSRLGTEPVDQHERVARNALLNHVFGQLDPPEPHCGGRTADFDYRLERKLLSDRLGRLQVEGVSADCSELTHLQWLINQACLAIGGIKPGDRSLQDRNYAVLRTDLDKAFAWARHNDL